METAARPKPPKFDDMKATKSAIDSLKSEVVLVGFIVPAFVFNYIWRERGRIEPRTAQ
jgi:hypothetical protein